MTREKVENFVARWQQSTLKERSAAQSHFNELCAVLGVQTPTEADTDGTWYCFEKGAKKADGKDGWADVWKRACFGWEYKGKGKSLQDAFKQLQLYAPALEYPPLLIVSDFDTIEIHTAFTGMVPTTYKLTLNDLLDPEKLRLLQWAFTDPERLRPGQTRAQLTEAAARTFADLSQTLRGRGHAPLAVAHFSQRLLFCLFAEDIELLPNKLFSRLLDAGLARPDRLPAMLTDLFGAMATGGHIGFEPIDWFNGGLFDSAAALPLERADLRRLRDLAELDWSAIDPTIIGTLFERGLDPDKRSQLGAHYTDPASIGRLVEPVVLAPLRAEWAALQADLAARLAKAAASKSAAARTKGINDAQALLQGFLERLRNFRVLDPACGSGNFLLLALLGLKDFEHRVLLDAEALGLPRGLPMVGPECVLGIELNPYAAELARVTVWIGELQWMLGHGFSLARNPILKPLDTIAQRDALLSPLPAGSGAGGEGERAAETGEAAGAREADWPAADVIVGNPPFLGDKKLLGALGHDYVEQLRACYAGRVPGGADLVTYWFEKARAHIAAGQAKAAGLVATNSIRQQRNRPVLESIARSGRIFDAWSDEPWVNEGAAVRVSLVCFGPKDAPYPTRLNGAAVTEIHADLTAGAGLDLTRAGPLADNRGCSYFGLCLAGPFKVPAATAQEWLRQPNPHGRSNAEVLKPIYNGSDITRRWSGDWTVDFGLLEAEDAALFEAPFAHVVAHVQPLRLQNNRKARAEKWWRHGEARPGLRTRLAGRQRYLATPETAKYRLFVWLPATVAPEHSLIVIPREDDTTFGLLSSRFHTVWALTAGGRMGKGNDPRYNSSVTFETFPFPAGLTPADTAGPTEILDSGVILPTVAAGSRDYALAIAEAAHRLNARRDTWLNPPEWTERVPEIVPGYPDRILPKPGHEADLKQRTLTNLYNARPAWLDQAHRALDAAVAAAYGWEDYAPELPDAELLRRLLALNLERAG